MRIGSLMNKMIESRGDVAKSANQIASLQKMLAVMSLESLLKQAGGAIPEAVIKGLNVSLQKVKK